MKPAFSALAYNKANQPSAPSFEAPIPDITTEELARQCGIKPQSVRVRLCRTGSYFGVRPVKLPNQRLMWPGNARELMLANREVA
jgi:hypothetical protein